MEAAPANAPAQPAQAANRPPYPTPPNELLQIEIKARLVVQMGDADGFDWLRRDVIKGAYQKHMPLRKDALDIFTNKLLTDQAFRDLCDEVREMWRAGHLSAWRVAPYVRMRLTRHLAAGHMAVPVGQVVDERRAIQVILVPPKHQPGGPLSKPVNRLGTVQVRDVRDEAAGMNLPLALVEDTAGSFIMLRILQQLAKEKHWDAFRSLTENATGTAKRLVDLLGQTVSWCDDLERYRAELDAEWHERAQETGRNATRLYAEGMLGIQTMKSRFIKCDVGCTERLDVYAKNLSQFELGYVCRRRPLSTLRACPQCQRRGYHIFYFMLPQPALLAYHDGALEFGNIDKAFVSYEMELQMDDDNFYDLYAAVVVGRRGVGLEPMPPFVLLRRGGSWYRASSGLSMTWDVPFNHRVDCPIGLAVLLALYIRR